MDRREMLTVVGGALVGAAIAPAPAFAAAKDVPPELAAYFADQLVAHYTADTRLGARPLLAIVTTEYGVIREAADAAQPTIRRDLMSVGVGFAGFAGWLHQDSGDMVRSGQWCSEALALAHQVGDPNLVSYALASLAFLRLDAGDGHASVDLARAALEQPGLRPHTRRYALRHAAHALSQTGGRRDCDEMLDRIGTPVTSDDEPYRWGTPWWATPSFTTNSDAQRATCDGRLGRTTEAAGLWPKVLDQPQATARRDRGVYLTRYATALLDIEGPDAALSPAAEAADCFATAGSERMRRELMALRSRAVEQHGNTSGWDLYEVLRNV